MKKNIYKALGIGIPVLIIMLAIIFSQPKDIKQLALDYDSITLTDIGDMQTLNFSYSPDNAKIPDIAYVSTNTDIAKFEDNRLIGVSEGTTQVYIRVKGSDIVSNKVNVIVKDKTPDLMPQPTAPEQTIESPAPTDSELSPTPTQEESLTESESDNIVYQGKTGTKYHRESCRTLRGNGIAITMQEALSQGREACKVCKPE